MQSVVAESLPRTLAGVTPEAFGQNVRFFSLDGDVKVPAGFEGSWSRMSPDTRVSQESWATEEEMSQTTAFVIFTGGPSEAQNGCFQELAKHLREHPLTAPPVLIVPLVGHGDLAGVRPWVERLVRDSIVDEAIWGAPKGYALALAIQAKLCSVAAQLDKLAEEVDKRAESTVEKEQLMQSMEYMRWQYGRGRLFRAIPPTEPEIEHGGSVLGYRLGRKISRGAFGLVCAATNEDPTAAPEHTGMLVVDKHKSVRSFGDVRVIDTFLTVMDRLAHAPPHPNVSRLLECYSSPKHLYVCVSLAGQKTLFTRLSQRDSPTRGATPLPIMSSGMQAIAAQVSAAVCHLHVAADVCHRDIKPENISVHELADGVMQAKLFGFELSNIQRDGETCKRACGTLPFAAPEVILADNKTGHDGKAADMWSLGVVLLELSCGLRSVERALPPMSSAAAGQKGNRRPPPPPAAVAQELCRTFKKPAFLSGLLANAVPEAAALQPWLDSAVKGMLDVNPKHRVTAAVLGPSVTK